MDKGRTLIRLRADALYKAAVPSAVTNVLATILMITLFWAPGRERGLGLWLLAAIMILIVRATLAEFYRQGRPARLTARQWAWIGAGTTGLSGINWGLVSLWLVPQIDDFQLVALATVCMGGVMAMIPYAAFWPAHLFYHVPIFTLGGFGFLRSDHPEGAVMAISGWLICVAIAVLGRRLGDDITRAMALSIENEELARDLAQRAEELERLNRELDLLSRTDGLTGLANRRSFYDYLESEWPRAVAKGTPLAVFMIDVDHFKAYNDAHGHGLGDLALRQLGQRLSEAIPRQAGLVARVGGEEFAALLPGLNAEQAAALGERIRLAAARLPTDAAAGRPPPITLSIGVHTLRPGLGVSFESALSEADKALYEAKARGRNRVCVAPASDQAHAVQAV